MKRKILALSVFLTLVITAFAIVPSNVGAADPEDIEQAIVDGLTWLVAQQDTTAGPNYGSWVGYGSREAGTGLALYKLCDRAYELGYESPFDTEYEYYQNVIDGFNWVFDHLVLVDIGVQDHTGGASGTMDDPDVLVDGKGITTQSAYSSYTTGILLAAVAASGTSTRTVNVPTSPVNGWTYGDVAQDMVDFLAFAQVDPSMDFGGYTVEGGWDYTPVNNGAGGTGWQGDQSNSGYAVLGLGEAQDFGCTIPQWVKTELNWWIDWVQDDVDGDTNDGGSMYSYPNDGIGINILKTGNLIFQMAFVGDTPTTTRVVDALDYLERHWGDASGVNTPPGWDGNPAQYQAMFCAMKGLEYMGIDEFGDPAIDWFEDFSDAIVAQQDKTPGPTYGSWQSSSGRSEPVIVTEWALLTLERVAPQAKMTVVDLIAGGGNPNSAIDVGEVTVTQEGEDEDKYLYITYETTDDWWITETHCHVAWDEDGDGYPDFPMTKKGNPKVGHFDYSMDHDPPVQEYTYEIPWDEDWPETFYIAAHSVVQKVVGYDEEGNPIYQTETAWGDGLDGIPFPGNNWAKYFEYIDP